MQFASLRNSLDFFFFNSDSLLQVLNVVLYVMGNGDSHIYHMMDMVAEENRTVKLT